MRSIKVDKFVADFCYKTDSRDLARPEEKTVSAAFFYKPGLKHVVLADTKENIRIIKEWNDDLIRVYGQPRLSPYDCRLIVWKGRGWFILSMPESVFQSLCAYVVDSGYMLTERSFEFEDEYGNTSMFPFHSPTFRMLRPQPLRLEQPQLLLK